MCTRLRAGARQAVLPRRRRPIRACGCVERERVTKPAAIIWILCLAVLLGVISCSSYVYQAVQTKNFLSHREYARALETVEKSDNGSSRLLYLYEKGLILHYANDFEKSNEAFAEAELILDDLYTRSLSREIGALFTSDTVVEYRGERYEAAFVHYYQILNYLYLDQLDAAVVECRQLNHKLQLFEDMGDSRYRNDPFLQYLTGMIYRERGDRVDADVSFRSALDWYQRGEGGAVPDILYQDLAAVARSFGDGEAVARYSANVRETAVPESGSPSGVLTLFLECGYIPGMVEESVSLPIYREDMKRDLDDDEFAGLLVRRHGEKERRSVKVDYWLKVAIPSMRAEPTGVQSARIITEDETRIVHVATPAVDFSALAFEAFDQRKDTIFLKTVARALTKYLAKKKAEDKKGELAGWVVNIFNAATETADTRSWTTLPEKILMARLVLPEGRHTLTVHLLDEAGQLLDTVTVQDIEVIANKRRFMNYRVF